MLEPKRTKYRKPHKISFEGKSKGNNYLAFGEYGLLALSGAWISNRQIEAARVAISKNLGKVGKMWIRVFPHLSLTKKPLEVRMGSGKGAPEKWVAVIKKGTILFEIANIPEKIAKKALKNAGSKLSVSWKIISKEKGVWLKN